MILLFFVAAVPAHATTLQNYQNEAQNIQSERKELKEQIEKTEEKSERIELSQKENALSGYEKAYVKALQLMGAGIEGETSNLVNQLITQEGGVPIEYLPIYKVAAEVYSIDWELLAAIHKQETNFSSITDMVSSAGATGHMQFMPKTWEAYGVDANDDGIKDPYNIFDAIFSAANYLSASGASEGKSEQAIFAYNHADWYVEDILNQVAIYKESYSEAGVSVIDIGKQFIGKSTYVFGGGRNQTDISNGIFDCSSFIHYVFNNAGVDLGNLSSVTTDTLKIQGEAIEINKMEPGDLVFFDTYKKDGHVGIYIGDGKFIGAQSSTGVAIESMTRGYWKEKFNGRVKRL